MRIRIPSHEYALGNAELHQIQRQALNGSLVSIHARRGRIFLDVTLFADEGYGGKFREVTRSIPLWSLLRDNQLNEWIEDPKKNQAAWDSMERIAKKFSKLCSR